MDLRAVCLVRAMCDVQRLEKNEFSGLTLVLLHGALVKSRVETLIDIKFNAMWRDTSR